MKNNNNKTETHNYVSKIINEVKALPDIINKNKLFMYIQWAMVDTELDAYKNARDILTKSETLEQALGEIEETIDTIYDCM